MSKNIIILKGVPGCGKTTFSKMFPNSVVCCADDYHIDSNGVYRWKPENVKKSHEYCQKTFNEAMINPEVENVIVANTNTKPSDWKYYVDRGSDLSANIFHIVVENRHGGTNVHDVPEETLVRMENTLRSNIKLR